MPGRTRPGATVYIVDDHPVVRSGLRALLEANGFRVLGDTGEPLVAVDEVPRLQPAVLLLDVQLGDDSGLDVLDALRRRGSEVRVAVFSMSAGRRDLARALRAGASGYLLKDAPPADLLACVAATARGERYLGQGLADRALQALTDAPPAVERLSARERQMVALVARGLSSAAIAERMHLSPKTVDTYRSRIMGKVGVADLAGLVRWAVREGLVDLEER
jgi:DNA-binding NarL/FixJ family response regulator